TFTVDAFVPIAYTYRVTPVTEVYVDDDDAAAGKGVRYLANIFVPGADGARVLSATGDGRSGPSTVKAGEGSRKQSNVITVVSGELFVNPLRNTTIRFGAGSGFENAEVCATKGALLSVSVERCGLRVAACSGPGDVILKAFGRSIALNPGQEVVVSNHVLTGEEHHKSDGVGRRQSRTVALSGGLYATICDVSIVSMVA